MSLSKILFKAGEIASLVFIWSITLGILACSVGSFYLGNWPSGVALILTSSPFLSIGLMMLADQFSD